MEDGGGGREAGSILGYTGMQAEVGGRKAHRANKADSLRLWVEGAVLARALRQKQSKTSLRRNGSAEITGRTMRGLQGAWKPRSCHHRGRARGC